MKNAFSIDLEDWFCAHNLASATPHGDWTKCELRLEAPTRRLLALLDRHGVHGTFFVLGWIADRCPGLVAAIAAAGHEVASHGYSHLLMKELTPHQFEDDLRKSIQAIQRSSGQTPLGYRCASFSINASKRWTYDVLARNGIRYDSSSFPVSFHPDYGRSARELGPHRISDTVIEFPLSCFTCMGVHIPCCGGAYFRLFPYSLTAYGVRKCNRQKRPTVFYIHPWELDIGQPRLNVPLFKALRHYTNLEKTAGRLERLLSEFEFGTVASVLGLDHSGMAGTHEHQAWPGP